MIVWIHPELKTIGREYSILPAEFFGSSAITEAWMTSQPVQQVHRGAEAQRKRETTPAGGGWATRPVKQVRRGTEKGRNNPSRGRLGYMR